MADGRTVTTEPFIRTVTRFAGPWGRHVSGARHWINPANVAIVLGTLLWMITVLRQQPCRQTDPGRVPNSFAEQCYSDIPLLYVSRGLVDGKVPYFGDGPTLEYPALTGLFMELARRITGWLGVPVGPGLSDLDRINATSTFYSVNMVLLFVLWLVTILAHLGASRGRGWDVAMLVASPSVVLTGLINWDMLPVALTALGVFFWARRRPGLAGLLLGLAMAAKLYPLFLLWPLLLLCLRAGRIRAFGTTALGFAVGWLVPNLPVIIGAPSAWARFWTFNADRPGDFGSMWYLFVLNGRPVPDLNLVTALAFLVGCLAVGALTLFAPRRPRVAHVMLLVLLAFLMTNKVYSPQYVLWILPFVALCRPRWRDWLIFIAGEWLYVMAIWGHLGQYLTPGAGGPDKLYWLATILRLCTQAWLASVVVRSVLEPETDLVRVSADRRHYIDDPSGGVLDGATDARWPAALMARVQASFAGVRSIIPAAALVPVRDREATNRTGLWWVGGVWLASRLLLLAVAIYAVVESTNLGFLDVLDNWDAEHFLKIAEQGYVTEGDDAKRMAFFPGLPLLLAPFVALGIPGQLVGVLLSLICSAVAAVALYRLGGFWAAALWLIAPAAIFTFVPYTEALFCAFAFWAWERARSDRWAQAALLAAGACSVRVSGIFLVGALGIMILTRPMADGTTLAGRFAEWIKRAVWLLIPMASVFLYALYLFLRTGSWTAWYTAQEAGWSRAWTSPLVAIKTTIDVITSDMYDNRPGWDTVFTFELVSFAVGLVAVGWLIRRRMWAEMSWIAVQLVAFSLSEWLFSVNRAVLLWFPVWLIAAELIRRNPRTPIGRAGHRFAMIAWVVASVLTMMWWARMFYLGQWSS